MTNNVFPITSFLLIEKRHIKGIGTDDTDIFVLLVHYFVKLSYQDLQELWVLFGIGENPCYIPIYSLIKNVGLLITTGI